MGIAQADLYGNGYPVYALTSMGDTKLQKLDEEADTDRPVYKDIAYPMGATAAPPLYRRRRAALDRLAQPVRRLQQ